MPLFQCRYQKTGFRLCFLLSFIYLPLVISLLISNKFIEHQVLNLIVFISFTITFITAINYKILLLIKEKNPLGFLRDFLIPLNFLIVILLFVFLPFEFHRNSLIMSLVFIGIPWFFYFKRAYKRHVSRFIS